MRLKKLFVILLVVNTICLSIVVFIISKYNDAINELEDAYQMQHKSFILADELRQSSDDLTRVARTYVITGKDIFKEQFQTILDIRDGRKNRPKDYNGIFWDFYTISQEDIKYEDSAIALTKLMKEAGFEEDELALLYKSKKESDDLTSLETKAMNAIKGKFVDENGSYTIEGEPNFEMAITIMHSDEYHKAKIAIMEPIDEFYKKFEARTKQKINQAHEKTKKLENYVGIAILILIVLVLFSFFIILSRLIYPLENLKNAMLRLASNKMDTILPSNEYNDEVGEMIGAVEVFKENAIKLIQSEQKNKLLLDLAGEGIFGLNDLGYFTFLNPKACELLGIKDQHELINKHLLDIFPNDTILETKSQKLMLSKIDDPKFINKDGFTFPIDYVSTPIFGKQEILNGAVVVFSDITNRKIDEEKLKTAMSEANAANKSKSQFLANMSHELRTPLNAILGFTTLLKKKTTKESMEYDNLSIIENSGRYLLTLINEILDFAKLEAKEIELNNTQFDFYLLLDEIKNMFLSKCKEADIEFVVDIKVGVPRYIECDEKRLKQILLNLLSNSIKFTKKGYIKLSIKYLNGSMEFEVIDTGIGISKDNLDKVFKPFEQITRNDFKSNGTGLGLAISKKLVQKMGGDINLKSEINKGSNFKFDIKVNKVNKLLSNTSKYSDFTTIENADKYTVLVADDIKENRELLAQSLETYNFNVISVSNGLEALDTFKTNTIDIVLLDLDMPVMNGIEAMNNIKKLNKNIPVVIISAHVFEKDIKMSKNFGANEFLQKPINFNKLYNILQKYLNITLVDITKDKIEKEKLTNQVNYDTLSSLDKESIINACNELDVNRIITIIEQINLQSSHKEELKTFCNNFDFISIKTFINKHY